MLKLTIDKHEASCGRCATAELLVKFHNCDIMGWLLNSKTKAKLDTTTSETLTLYSAKAKCHIV